MLRLHTLVRLCHITCKVTTICTGPVTICHNLRSPNHSLQVTKTVCLSHYMFGCKTERSIYAGHLQFASYKNNFLVTLHVRYRTYHAWWQQNKICPPSAVWTTPLDVASLTSQVLLKMIDSVRIQDRPPLQRLFLGRRSRGDKFSCSEDKSGDSAFSNIRYVASLHFYIDSLYPQI